MSTARISTGHYAAIVAIMAGNDQHTVDYRTRLRLDGILNLEPMYTLSYRLDTGQWLDLITYTSVGVNVVNLTYPNLDRQGVRRRINRYSHVRFYARLGRLYVVTKASMSTYEGAASYSYKWANLPCSGRRNAVHIPWTVLADTPQGWRTTPDTGRAVAEWA